MMLSSSILWKTPHWCIQSLITSKTAQWITDCRVSTSGPIDWTQLKSYEEIPSLILATLCKHPSQMIYFEESVAKLNRTLATSLSEKKNDFLNLQIKSTPTINYKILDAYSPLIPIVAQVKELFEFMISLLSVNQIRPSADLLTKVESIALFILTGKDMMGINPQITWKDVLNRFDAILELWQILPQIFFFLWISNDLQLIQEYLSNLWMGCHKVREDEEIAESLRRSFILQTLSTHHGALRGTAQPSHIKSIFSPKHPLGVVPRAALQHGGIPHIISPILIKSANLAFNKLFQLVIYPDDLVRDLANNWCYSTSYGISAGPKFTALSSNLCQFPFVVSFIGSRSCGKSFLIRSLIKEGHPRPNSAPLPTPNKAPVPVSIDVSAYLSNPEDDSNCMIFMECEGFDDKNPLSGVRKIQRTSLERKHEIDFYPVLLYGISNVVCYIISNLANDEFKIHAQKLVDIAKKAEDAASANSRTTPKPQLLFLINNVEFYSGKTTDFPIECESLLVYYSSIQILSIPRIQGAPEDFQGPAAQALLATSYRQFELAHSNFKKQLQTLFDNFKLQLSSSSSSPSSSVPNSLNTTDNRGFKQSFIDAVNSYNNSQTLLRSAASSSVLAQQPPLQDPSTQPRTFHDISVRILILEGSEDPKGHCSATENIARRLGTSVGNLFDLVISVGRDNELIANAIRGNSIVREHLDSIEVPIWSAQHCALQTASKKWPNRRVSTILHLNCDQSSSNAVPPVPLTVPMGTRIHLVCTHQFLQFDLLDYALDSLQSSIFIFQTSSLWNNFVRVSSQGDWTPLGSIGCISRFDENLGIMKFFSRLKSIPNLHESDQTSITTSCILSYGPSTSNNEVQMSIKCSAKFNPATQLFDTFLLTSDLYQFLTSYKPDFSTINTPNMPSTLSLTTTFLKVEIILHEVSGGTSLIHPFVISKLLFRFDWLQENSNTWEPYASYLVPSSFQPDFGTSLESRSSIEQAISHMLAREEIDTAPEFLPTDRDEHHSNFFDWTYSFGRFCVPCLSMSNMLYLDPNLVSLELIVAKIPELDAITILSSLHSLTNLRLLSAYNDDLQTFSFSKPSNKDINNFNFLPRSLKSLHLNWIRIVKSFEGLTPNLTCLNLQSGIMDNFTDHTMVNVLPKSLLSLQLTTLVDRSILIEDDSSAALEGQPHQHRKLVHCITQFPENLTYLSINVHHTMINAPSMRLQLPNTIVGCPFKVPPSAVKRKMKFSVQIDPAPVNNTSLDQMLQFPSSSSSSSHARHASNVQIQHPPISPVVGLIVDESQYSSKLASFSANFTLMAEIPPHELPKITDETFIFPENLIPSITFVPIDNDSEMNANIVSNHFMVLKRSLESSSSNSLPPKFVTSFGMKSGPLTVLPSSSASSIHPKGFYSAPICLQSASISSSSDASTGSSLASIVDNPSEDPTAYMHYSRS